MPKKKNKSTHQQFESNTTHGRFTKICNDMIDSPAFNNLSLRQQGLYLQFKKKYMQKVLDGVVVQSNVNNISFTYKEAKQIYGDMRTFRDDIEALIDNGFIKLIAQGGKSNYYSGEKSCFSSNIYGFSSEWKNIK